MSIKIQNKGKIDWDKNIDKIFGSKFRMICAQVIKKGIKDGLKSGKDINGTKFKKLKAATVKQKKKKGYKSPSKPLIATGMMSKLPPIKNKLNHSEVRTAKKREDIAVYHNRGMTPQPKREWFGVSLDAKKNIGRAVAKKVVQILKRGYRLPNKL